tara:strand:- start:12522 stop:12677 length:156 start_codon:yes stop_codon:yes gene_type:complete
MILGLLTVINLKISLLDTFNSLPASALNALLGENGGFLNDQKMNVKSKKSE